MSDRSVLDMFRNPMNNVKQRDMVMVLLFILLVPLYFVIISDNNKFEVARQTTFYNDAKESTEVAYHPPYQTSSEQNLRRSNMFDPKTVKIKRTRDKSHLFENAMSVLESSQAGSNEVPFFFLVPKSGTTSLRNVISKCVKLRMAASTGLLDYKDFKNAKQVEVIDLENKGKYINIDFTVPEGIKEAQRLNMGASDLVDIAMTSYLHPGVNVFSPSKKVRVFALFRHPVERTISAFHYSKVGTWEKTYREENQQFSMLEYALDPGHHVDNWVTRMLADVHNEPLVYDDYLYARHVMKEKILVMLLDDLHESVDRVFTYLNWSRPEKNAEGKECMERFLSTKSSAANSVRHDGIIGGSKEWQMLESINEYDMMLYWYAKELYHGEQKKMIDEMKLRQTHAGHLQ